MSFIGLLLLIGTTEASEGLSVGIGTLGTSLTYSDILPNNMYVYVQGHFKPGLPKDTTTSYEDGTSRIYPFRLTKNNTGIKMGLRYIPFVEFPEIQLTTGLMYNLASNTSILDLSEENIVNVTAISRFNLLQPYLGTTYSNHTKFGMEYAVDLGILYQGTSDTTINITYYNQEFDLNQIESTNNFYKTELNTNDLSSRIYYVAQFRVMTRIINKELQPVLESKKSLAETNTIPLIEKSPHPDNANIILQKIDVNNDQKPDIINHYQERINNTPLRVLKEVDINYDGKMDIKTYFDVDQNVTREEIDSDYDGIVDWVDHFYKGKKIRTEKDVDSNGNIDTIIHYREEVIYQQEKDTTGDGYFDQKVLFDENGNAIKSVQLDQDGSIEERHEGKGKSIKANVTLERLKQSSAKDNTNEENSDDVESNDVESNDVESNDVESNDVDSE